jgi:2-methylcitrate dehydratase PrpD
MLSAALLYDDTCLAMHGHASSTLLPVILGLGEYRRLSGRELLAAYMIGFEVESAIGLSVEPEHYEKGWHATSTVGSLGAAAAACRLLGATKDQVRMALGIATSLTGGSRQNFGTMVQAFHAGMAARNGMVAALMAGRGFTADPNILESRMGFFTLFGAGEPERLEKEVATLGREYSILGLVLYLKLFPCGFPLQRPIEGVIGLTLEHDIQGQDVEEVRCGVHYLIPETVFHVNPSTGLQGRTSIPYCAARAILDRRMGLAQFTDEKVCDPAVQELMKKVVVEVPPELSREALRGKVGSIAAPAVITIRLKDGREVSQRVEYFRGAPERPLSRNEVVEKFRDCAGMVLSADRVEATRDIVENLEDLKDAAELAALLRV